MRLAGTFATESDAQRFSDYLLTQGIGTRVMPEGAAFGLWVRDDAHLDRVREEAAAFAAAPNDPKYSSAQGQAATLRKVETSRDIQARRNVVQMRELWRRPNPRGTPLVLLLLFICIAVAVYTHLGNREEGGGLTQQLQISDRMSIDEHGAPTFSLEQVREGEVWRLITPIFLHFSILHLLFNMSALFQLGSAIETIDGTWRFALMVLVLAIVSNLAQFYFHWLDKYLVDPQKVVFIPLPFFGGMSGVVYGLFGYVWIRGRRDRTSRYHMDDQTIIIMLAWFFLCLIGVFGRIANTAHAAGLVSGMAIGFAAAKMRFKR